MTWTEKHRPESVSDIYGNDSERRELLKWASRWDSNKDAVVVHGPPGIGKTTAAHALANDKGWDVVELNASDQRTGDLMEKVAGGAAQNQSLTGESNRKLIILDEADNIHGNSDRGGSRALGKIVKSASQPMVLIANGYYDMTKTLRNECKEIEFEPVGKSDIAKTLRDICQAEGIEFEREALLVIAKQSQGDVRAAVNDLHTAASGEDEITEEMVHKVERGQTRGIFPFLDDLFKNMDPEEVQKASMDVDETPDSLIGWIENNISSVYSGQELADAYEFLSNADQWLGTVYETQDYTYWRYATANMTSGVAASRQGSKGGWTSYSPDRYSSNSFPLEEVAQRIAEEEGVSINIARRGYLPFLEGMTHHCKPRDLTVEIAAKYDLDEKELSELTGSGKTTNKVESIIEDAQEIRSESAYQNDSDELSPFSRPESSSSQQDTTTSTESVQTMEESSTTTVEEEDDSDDDQSGLGDFM